MVKINKTTKERELLWCPEMDEIDADEEVKSAKEFYGDDFIFVFELVG